MTLIHRILVVWNWKCAFRLNDFNNLVDDSKIYTCLHVTIFRIIYKFERIVKELKIGEESMRLWSNSNSDSDLSK